LASIFFTDANTGYAVGEFGLILQTTDGGANWIPQTSGTQSSLYSITFPDTKTGYIVGDYGTILKTNNGGEQWKPIISRTSNSLASVCFTDVNTGYVVGSGGTILKTTNGGNGQPEITGNTNRILLYPNPATEKVTLDLLDVITHGDASLSIYSVQGVLLLHQPLTRKKTEIDISDFKVGVYLVGIRGDHIVTGKLVKH
jgi:photosystem II stability/assembly factor-like uncharacterized protein